MSGAINAVTNLIGATGQALGDISRLGGLAAQTAGLAARIDTSTIPWSEGGWWEQLQPGSWRGVPFVLDAGETRAGRRLAVHEYPYRDTVWVEDLGKLPRRFAVQAFLTGDDVYQQRDALVAACETPGPGTLVHPTLGAVDCVLLEFSVTDRRERGRFVEVVFTFVIAGDVLYPTSIVASGDAVLARAGDLGRALGLDLGATVAAIPAIPAIASAVGGFTSMTIAAVNDASRVLGAVRGLQGFYGRYATGRRATLQPATATVHSVLAGATAARTLVYTTAATVDRLASLL